MDFGEGQMERGTIRHNHRHRTTNNGDDDDDDGVHNHRVFEEYT